MTSNSSPSNKTLAVVGSGADTVAGNLIYKLGGIELPMLAELQKQGINSYDKAVQYLTDRHEELYFFTPQHRVTVKVQRQIESCDRLLLIITPPPPASRTMFEESIAHQLAGSATFFAKRITIVLMKTSESHEWSEHEYNNSNQSIRAALQQFGISAESTLIIPSGPQGENIIDHSPETPWYSKPTLVTALDEVFS